MEEGIQSYNPNNDSPIGFIELEHNKVMEQISPIFRKGLRDELTEEIKVDPEKLVNKESLEKYSLGDLKIRRPDPTTTLIVRRGGSHTYQLTDGNYKPGLLECVDFYFVYTGKVKYSLKKLVPLFRNHDPAGCRVARLYLEYRVEDPKLVCELGNERADFLSDYLRTSLDLKLREGPKKGVRVAEPGFNSLISEEMGDLMSKYLKENGIALSTLNFVLDMDQLTKDVARAVGVMEATQVIGINLLTLQSAYADAKADLEDRIIQKTRSRELSAARHNRLLTETDVGTRNLLAGNQIALEEKLAQLWMNVTESYYNLRVKALVDAKQVVSGLEDYIKSDKANVMMGVFILDYMKEISQRSLGEISLDGSEKLIFRAKEELLDFRRKLNHADYLNKVYPTELRKLEALRGVLEGVDVSLIIESDKLKQYGSLFKSIFPDIAKLFVKDTNSSKEEER